MQIFLSPVFEYSLASPAAENVQTVLVRRSNFLPILHIHGMSTDCAPTAFRSSIRQQHKCHIRHCVLSWPAIWLYALGVGREVFHNF